jgi:hypothetical protein
MKKLLLQPLLLLAACSMIVEKPKVNLSVYVLPDLTATGSPSTFS